MMVQPAASISRILSTLRPPTPPRESAVESNPPNLFSRIFSATSQADITPNSSSESSNPTEQLKKRVAWDDNNDKFAASDTSAAQLSGERKPIKSILKPYNGNSIQLSLPKSKLSPPHTYANLAAMLESIAQQLDGTDRSSKMDAYTTLSGVLKASENVPDVRALKEKMGSLLGFIKQDLTAKTSAGTLDTTLVVNALILVSIFLHRPAIADTLTTSFSTDIVDHAIRTFEDPSMSKDVVKHLMLILAEQKFSSKIMSGDRVGRLIASLHNIENHVKGKSIVMGRINIYRTLLRQSRAHMLVNTDWMEDLFGDMFSTVKETKASGIAFGLESGLVLGTEGRASRAFMELFSGLFSGELGDGIKFGDYYTGRLKAMVEGKHDIASVPQIWSIPVLFLRSKPLQFEQWAFMTPWLGILQACFNSSDQQAKLEANLAWNRLVFAQQPDEKTSPKMMNLLYQALREQLRRKYKGNKGRKAALGSLCNLLYYSLKPTSTSAQLDIYWDRYIVDAVGKAFVTRNTNTSTPELARQDLMDACGILTGLFDSTTPRTWSETRAMDACTGKDTCMEAGELPALDSRWLRKSAERVFPVIGPLLEKLYWDLGEESETVAVLWRAYVTSIASPAIKEVKVSNETMSCVAYILGLLYKIWQIGPKSLQSAPPSEGTLSANFLSSFESIISTTIKGLGPLPFTEKLLSIGSQDEFVVIATPSHQPRKARGEPRCPLHHLFVLLTNLSPSLEYDRNFSQMVRQILSPFFDARPSKRAKLDFIQDLLGLLPVETNEPCRMIWFVLADLATFAMDTRDEITNGAGGMSDQPLGADYRAAMKILEFGVDLSPTELLPGWKVLFEALVTSATIDAGDAGRAIAVIEPLGKMLQSQLSKNEAQSNSRGYVYFRTVLSKATYPKDRQAFDSARRRLWGTVTPKTSSFDPYTQLYEYVRESLQNVYTSFTASLSLEYSDMISATTGLLTQCPIPLLTNTIAKLQIGMANWIMDDSSRIVGGTALSQSIISLWSRICQVITILTRHANHSKLLADLEVLICSGFESRHRSIVNSTIRLWNTTFGSSKENLTYPSQIQQALLKLRSVAELQLPSFPESLESAGVVDQRQLPNFAETQDNSSHFFGSIGIDSVLRVQPTSHSGISPSLSSKLRDFTPQVVIKVAQSGPLKRSRESTPDPNNRKSRKRNSAPKLRHDDSQIQFETIESSPIANAVLDSQLLTDRQKEVKERQQAEAAMFPDLRSSPRRREKSRPSSSSELPFHRSASKSRTTTSPVIERQATPTPQAEYDDYVNSSPTPTRALPDGGNLGDVPFSPPEASKENIATYLEDEAEIPSSPPEMPNEMEIETITSLGPSAQIDPYAEENLQTLSPVENRQPTDPTDIVVPADDHKLASTYETSMAEAESSQPSLVPELAAIKEATVAVPNTPLRGRESSPNVFQTPRSETFHDARASPASSNKQTVEDVFEDAFSSPRLNLHKANIEQTSSPLSYLDESSALRLMAGYDQGSGRPRRSPRSVGFAVDKENQSEAVSPTSKALPQSAVSKEVVAERVDGEERPPSRVSKKVTDKEPALPVEEAANSSPMPSLIPETPGPKAAMNLQIVDGEEIDMDETIIVDDSILYEQDAPVVKRRKRKSDINQGTVGTPASKKGKHEQVVAESSEVSGSQEAKPEIFSPKKKPSPKKRKPGRPKRGSRVSSLTREGSQHSRSQSFSSVDGEGSMQDSQEMEMTIKVAASTANEVIIIRANEAAVEERYEVAQTMEHVRLPNHEELKVAEGEDDEQRPDQEMEITSSVINNEVNTSDIEMVADTIIGESSSLDNPSSAPSKPEARAEAQVLKDAEAREEDEVMEEAEDTEKAVMGTSRIMKMSSEPVGQVLTIQADASVQTEVVVEAPTAQSLKDKLQSIIGDLGTVALSRNEMNEIEDLFMDAKQLLYGAGQRGRAGSG